MSTNVTHLTGARRGNVRCPETKVVFPQLFRLTGYAFKFREGRSYVNGLIQTRDDLETDYACPIEPSYTLDQDIAFAPAAPSWKLIQHLDLSVDTGLVYIRHHSNADTMDAYIDAVCDTEQYDMENRWSSYCTAFGYFTLLHRKAYHGGAQCAVVYTTKLFDEQLDCLIDWYHVIGPCGKVLLFEDLLPPEIRAQYEPVLEYVNNSD
jgi:hypothetical protein